MSNTSRAWKRDAEWLLGAWHWAGDIGANTSRGVRLSLTPGTRKGVWVVRAQSVEVVEGRAVGVHTQVEGEYPTAYQEDFGAFVLNMLMKLDARLECTPIERAALP